MLLVKVSILSVFLLMMCFVSSAQSVARTAIEKEFATDTACIERACRFTAVDWGLEQSYIERRYGYEGLISKYSNLLLGRLDESGKEKFAQSNTYRIGLYNTQVELLSNILYSNNSLALSEGVNISEEYSRITAELMYSRVMELYNYLKLTEK